MTVVIEKKRNSINFVRNVGDVYETSVFNDKEQLGILAVLLECISCCDDVSVSFHEDDCDA